MEHMKEDEEEGSDMVVIGEFAAVPKHGWVTV